MVPGGPFLRRITHTFISRFRLQLGGAKGISRCDYRSRPQRRLRVPRMHIQPFPETIVYHGKGPAIYAVWHWNMNYRSLQTHPVTAVTVTLMAMTVWASTLSAATPLDDSLNTTLNGS